MPKVEKRILIALLANLRMVGFVPAAVWTGECYVMRNGFHKLTEYARDEAEGEDGLKQLQSPLSVKDVMSVFADYSMGAPTVHFTDQHKLTWSLGIMVVPGNGRDFISDYHTSDKTFTGIVNAVCTAANDGAYD